MTFENPATDAICFHIEQCVEKYLKAYLVFHQKYFRKTHDIEELIRLCEEIEPEFESLFKFNADELTIYATELRYAEDFYIPSLEETEDTIEIATKVRNFVRERLKSEGFEL